MDANDEEGFKNMGLYAQDDDGKSPQAKRKPKDLREGEEQGEDFW